MTDNIEVFAVYDADGTLAGELAYMLGKIRGRRECALCDISHGWHPLGKSEWRRARGCGTPIQWLHRNEQSQELRQTTASKLPAVVMKHSGGLEILITREQLMALEGDFEAFQKLLEERLAHLDHGYFGSRAS